MNSLCNINYARCFIIPHTGQQANRTAIVCLTREKKRNFRVVREVKYAVDRNSYDSIFLSKYTEKFSRR